MARVFISYAHRDNESTDHAKRWLDRMREHLAPLSFDEIIEVSSDKDINLGENWHGVIQGGLARADAAVLLVSPAFMASDYIRSNELPILLRRARDEGLKIIPVILRPCLFAETRFKYPDPKRGPEEFTLASLQAAGSPAKALNEMNEGEQDRALLGVAQELLKYAKARHRQVVATAASLAAPLVDITHLPKGADHFFGRKDEIDELDAAWADSHGTHIIQLIASGGTGKTALVKHWLDGMRTQDWKGAERVFAWSFYSQGNDKDRQASDDLFLSTALKWFGVDIDPSRHPWDKGQALAEALRKQRYLLLLDGLEPLQFPPAHQTEAGKLRAAGLESLLVQLATQGHPGLVVLTSRQPVANLEEWQRRDSHPSGCMVVRELLNLDEPAGARLLHTLGVRKAGAAAIEADDGELLEACKEVQGHALTLSLLGRYLAQGYGGDVRQRAQVDFQEADAETLNGHAFRVIQAYEAWFESAGKKGERELAALRLLGFFDHPASRESLRALRNAPAIPGLTRPLVTLTGAQWKSTLHRLQKCGLLSFDESSGRVDAHPLVREFFAARLRETQPMGWKEGHRRLYDQLKDSVPYRPDGQDGLQPLYQAVVHGCLAGLYEDALVKVYAERILRGTGQAGYYSVRQLGAFGADLGAVACFFNEPWRQPLSSLLPGGQAWLISEAAYRLRALGRLDEALEPMRAGAAMRIRQEDWNNASVSYGNQSEIELSLGRVKAALADAQVALAYANRTGDAFRRMAMETTLANALCQHGQGGGDIFAEAERLQGEDQPHYPRLYAVQGFRYCDWLLRAAERGAWLKWIGFQHANLCEGYTTFDISPELKGCEEVEARATYSMPISKKNGWLLPMALDHLMLARCALFSDLLQVRSPSGDAQQWAELAISALRQAARQDYLPRALLHRAMLRACLSDESCAKADLDEAWRIASRGNMRLHMADIHLHRARLFRDKAEFDKAKALIHECEYFRRLPELEDAEKLLFS